MIKRLFTLATVFCAVLFTGCAHPIKIAPELSKVLETRATRIDKKVGLAIASEDLQREVITPGGGGDKVRYHVYRDLQSGLQVALSQVFASVVRIEGPNDPKVGLEGLSLIVTPVITTNSASASAFTWPPTSFTVDLNCKVLDARGGTVAEVKATGAGQAEFAEFKSDFALSASRAAEDALTKLVKALSDAAVLRD